MSKLRQTSNTLEPRLAYWCQGCESAHVIRIQTDGYTPHPCWFWDGDEESPTFSPSILITWPGEICHSFVKEGMVQFLSDCTHKLAGQTVPLSDWPYDEGEYGGVEALVK